jgi:hypothetical protein
VAPARRLLVAFYLMAALAGAIVPYAILIPAADGLSAAGFMHGLFANPAASIFSADALMASLVFLALLVVEGRRADMPRLWAYVPPLLLFGLSCALPLFLAMREYTLRDRINP